VIVLLGVGVELEFAEDSPEMVSDCRKVAKNSVIVPVEAVEV